MNILVLEKNRVVENIPGNYQGDIDSYWEVK